MGFAFRPAVPRRNHEPSFDPVRLPMTLPVGCVAEAMAAHLEAARPLSGAEALQALRAAFPDSPLSTRAVVVAAMLRR